MDFFQHVLVFIAAYEGDGKTFGAESSSTSYSVKVGIAVSWHVKVEDDVDLLNVDTTAENLSCNKDTMLQLLAALVDLDALLLADAAVNGFRRQTMGVEYFSQFDGILNTLHENDDLVESQLVNEVDQLRDLVFVLKLHVVLSQTVQGELALVFDQHFSGVAHELPASLLNVAREGCSEHHDLLVDGGVLENFLDVAPHADLIKKLVAFVKDEHGEVVQVEGLVADER